MMLKKWDDLPEFIRKSEVKPYYDSLSKKKNQLIIKRIFDVVASLLLIIILAIPMFLIGVWVKLDSSGKVIFRQERVTQYGKRFMIHKFRTMTEVVKKDDALITTSDNPRITRVGKALRGKRLDELPQLFDILSGNMSFVGTRPEVPKYVERYSNEMLATLLMPAGVTSEASIVFKDEAKMLADSTDIDRDYVNTVLNQKMKYNLKGIREFRLEDEFMVLIRTIGICCNLKQ